MLRLDGIDEPSKLQIFIQILMQLFETKIRFKQSRTRAIIPVQIFVKKNKFRDSCEEFVFNLGVTWHYVESTGNSTRYIADGNKSQKLFASYTSCLEKIMEQLSTKAADNTNSAKKAHSQQSNQYKTYSSHQNVQYQQIQHSIPPQIHSNVLHNGYRQINSSMVPYHNSNHQQTIQQSTYHQPQPQYPLQPPKPPPPSQMNAISNNMAQTTMQNINNTPFSSQLSQPVQTYLADGGIGITRQSRSDTNVEEYKQYGNPVQTEYPNLMSSGCQNDSLRCGDHNDLLWPEQEFCAGDHNKTGMQYPIKYRL